MRPILLCYDGSEDARAAMRAAAGLLPAHESMVLHVAPPAVDWTAAPALGVVLESPADHDRLHERAASTLQEGVQLASELGLQPRGQLRSGGRAVWRAILEVADQADLRLIVAGSHGGHMRDHMPLGSVAHGLVSNASCPVLITHRGVPDAATGVQRVLVPHDGSATADAALDTAASSFQGADVQVVSVWQEGERAARVAAYAVAEAGARRVRALGGDATALAVPSADGVAGTIVRLAADLRTEVVVLGTHGLGSTPRTLVGSTAQQVLERAAVPVLVVPASVDAFGRHDAPLAAAATSVG